MTLAGWVINRVDPRLSRYEENLDTLKAMLPALISRELPFVDAVNEVDLHHCLDVSPLLLRPDIQQTFIESVYYLGQVWHRVAPGALPEPCIHISQGVNMEANYAIPGDQPGRHAGAGVVLNILFSVLGINKSSISGLLVFCAVFGFGGSFISLLMSKWMAKRSCGVRSSSSPQRDRALAGETLLPVRPVRLASRCRKWGSTTPRDERLCHRRPP